MKGLRILLGDDHPLVMKGIKGLLESHYEIVGCEENGKDLVGAALRLKPDLIVLDVSMPILNGIDAAREIKRVLPSMRFVFLSMHSSAIYLRRALEAGASGYVLKSGAAEELVTGIEEARKGNVYISPSFGHDVLESARDWREKRAKSKEGLTDRQKQILQLLAEGKQNKEIAETVHISVRTVEFHRSRLMTKFGARNLAELTMFGIREGLVFGVSD
jgi:DNA-binding NarL/FixJ family response regulator